MEIQAIILSISPVLISNLTQIVKSAQFVTKMDSIIRDSFLKTVTALGSFLMALVSFWAIGTPVSENVIETLLVSVALFLATSVPFWLAKSKKTT